MEILSTKRDHPFFLGAAALLMTLVLVGFAPTYYLRTWFGSPELPWLLHVHGAVLTAWFALFVVQVALVGSRQVGLHRTLGVAGVVLSFFVVALSAAVSIGLARARLALRPNSQGAPFLLGMQLLASLLIFAVLITLGFYWRRRGDYHKRAMTLAMLMVVGPAITRLPKLAEHDVSITIALNIGLLLGVVAVDAIWKRRLHPVFGWGAAITIGWMMLMAQFAQTPFWRGAVRRILT